MEGIASLVKQKRASDGPNVSYLESPIQIKNERDSHMENVLQSKCPPIKSEPCDASNDDDEKQLVPLQNFQFVEMDNEEILKSEIDIYEETIGTELKVFESETKDVPSPVCSRNQKVEILKSEVDICEETLGTDLKEFESETKYVPSPMCSSDHIKTDTLKSEIDLSEEIFDMESEVLTSEMRDDPSLMSSSDQIKIISAGGSNAGNFMLEIQGDTTCRSTVRETLMKKQLSSERVNTPQTFVIQHNYIRFQVCPNCESIFTSPEELASHQSSCNFISVPVEPVIAAKPYSKCQSQFPCSFCNKVLTSELKLDRHLLIHMDGPVSKCWLCDKTFQNKELDEHVKKHNVQTVICNICNKLLFGKYNIIRHKKLHVGERPYTCDHCGKSFALKNSLLYHIRAHNVECLFVCELCGKSFRNRQILNGHKATHIKKPLHGCEFCGQLFAQKSTPAAHLKLHLGERPFICE